MVERKMPVLGKNKKEMPVVGTKQPGAQNASPASQQPNTKTNTLLTKTVQRQTGAGRGGRVSYTEEESPTILGRVINTVTGGLKNTGGALIDTARTAFEAGSGVRGSMYEDMTAQYKKEYEQAQRDLFTMAQENRETPGTYSDAEMEGQRNILDDAKRKYLAAEQGGSKRVQQGAAEGAAEVADAVSDSGAKDIEEAKKGLGTFGQMLVDAGASTVQVAGDVAANALLGTGGSMIPFAARVFGGATQKARQEGGTLGQQVAYGVASTAKEIFTEKMFNIATPFTKAYGGGAMDDAVETAISKAVEKLAKTEAGAKLMGGAMTLGAGALSEGLEELIGDWIEWQLPRIYGGDVDSAAEVLKNSLYDFAVGTISGGIGSVVDSNTYNYDTTGYAGAKIDNAYDVMARDGMFSVSGQTALQETKGELKSSRELRMPRLTREDGSYLNENGVKRFDGVEEGKQADFREAEKIANAYGVTFHVADLGADAAGTYSNGVITINSRTENPVLQVLVHELTHHLENSGQYESFSNLVLQHISNDMGADVESMKNSITEEYRRYGTELDDAGAIRELVAKYAESALFKDEAAIQQLAQTNRSLFQKIYDWLRDAVTKVTGTSEEQFIWGAEKLYRKALADIGEVEEEIGNIRYLYRNESEDAQVEDHQRPYYDETAGEVMLKDSDGTWRPRSYFIRDEVENSERTLREMSPFSRGFEHRIRVNQTKLEFTPLATGEVTLGGKKAQKESYNVRNAVKEAGYATGTVVNEQTQIKVEMGKGFYTESATNAAYQKNQDSVSALAEAKTLMEKSVLVGACKVPIDHTSNLKRKNNPHRLFQYIFAAPYDMGGKKIAVLRVDVLENQGDAIHRAYNLRSVEYKEAPNQEPGNDPTAAFEAAAHDDGTSTISIADLVANINENLVGNHLEGRMVSDDIMPKLNDVQKSQGSSFDELLNSLREGQEDYLGALARDENTPTGERWTVTDSAREANLQRLQNEKSPPERTYEPIAKRDLDELVKLYQDIASPVTPAREARFEESEGLISSGTPKERKTVGQKAAETKSYFLRKMVDAGDSVTRIGKAVKDQYLYPYYNMARSSSSAGINMIQGEQTDITGREVGESLNSIFNPIRQKGEDYYNQFQTYLFDLHNVDRMTLVRGDNGAKIEAETALREFDRENPDVAQLTEARLERKANSIDEEEAALARERLRLLRAVNRADRMGNKPIFGYEVTADMSKERSDRLLREHPEFADCQKQVRQYIKNLMQYRVDSGLMTQEDAAFMGKYYPNYVPTYRKTVATPKGRDRRNIKVGKTVGVAQGGNKKLVPLHEALSEQTMQVVREGSKNRFGQRLLSAYSTAAEGVRKYILETKEYASDFDADTFDQIDTELRKNNTFTVFKNGKCYEMVVDDSLFDAVKALYPDAQENNILVNAIRAGNNLFKALVTGYNLTFTVRNTVRDLQTAGLYSKDAVAFTKNYPLALKEIKTNGSFWKQYKALGGSFSSVFDYQTGTVKEADGKVKKLAAKMEALNMAMEQAPRLAEFMSVVKAGDGSMENLMDAMHAAADVTVNFGRAGTLGKVLNANVTPFLNPGIQGFDKLIRRVTETRGGKEWAKLVVRAAVLGVAPAVLNDLLYSDDEDWEDLKNSDKDTNYLFKIRDGIWLKIPKGRELSILGMTADRIQDIMNGEDVDWRDFIITVGNQVAPANPLRENILTAWIDTDLFDSGNPGRTWYGGDIESQRLRDYAPGERYDGSTDIFSKWLGQQLNLSPKKINYLLDQYSGVVGDFMLPLLTPQAERNMFSKAFTVDSVSSNKISGEFYDIADELTYAKNSGDTTAKVLSRFWTKQQTACSDIYEQIRDIETSDLSDKEKKEQVRQAEATLNGIQKNALAVLNTYRKSVEEHRAGGTSDEAVEKAYREANKDCFGAEYALQAYNKDTYAKAQEAAKNGVSYDDFYTYYFDTKGYTKKGDKSVSTQKVEYLQRSSLSEESKAEIYFADLASDSDLKKQAELETSSGIGAVQYWQYKAATTGMSKKAEKLVAIDNLNLTSAQKTALYYANNWAESTLDEAPWISGSSNWVGPDITPKLDTGDISGSNLPGDGGAAPRINQSRAMPVLSERENGMPVLSKKG